MYQQQISIAIVDDHMMFREGLVNLIAEHPQMKVLFEARNGLAMQTELVNRGTPDVVLMDINMPGMNGHDATYWLKKHYPAVHVLALSMYEDDASIIKMIRAGAGGYILKESNVQELVRAIAGVYVHGHYVNDTVSGRLIRSVQDNKDDGKMNSVKLLSARELEFVQLCCSDLTYKEIADAMAVSPRTVDGYRDAVFEKLGIKSRTGLVLYAIKNGVFKVS